jgi:hypothetical protein
VILQLVTRMDNLAAAPYHKRSFLTKYKTGLRTSQHFVKEVMNIRFPHILTTQMTVNFKDGLCPCIQFINTVFPVYTMKTYWRSNHIAPLIVNIGARWR